MNLRNLTLKLYLETTKDRVRRISFSFAPQFTLEIPPIASSPLRKSIDAWVEGKKETLPLEWPSFSPLTREVLDLISEIPLGKTSTYGALLGNRYARFVGQVCHKNPFPLLIPCHRVVGKKALGGFAFGSDLKQLLLKAEGYLS